ncbi:carbamoyl transferase [Nonomuraea sp. K274]|uniref:Carbamoyl transferase n=1 Tax=Nonomuraea cypriaca TaxID=1187855 RepID=A0A931A3U9_9ACTN|nr:carbamoyltransferase C-terminal domain-containing protein [Nonomuraea cypriaca]MBF8184515.1 carbamoyl transferase [Nonomuraea cypriaca]
MMADLTNEILSAAGLVSTDIDGWIATSTESRDEADEAKLLSSLGLVAPPERCLTLPHPAHHLAHASAAFYSSGFDEAAALAIDCYGSLIDGGRERETAFFFRVGERPKDVMRLKRDVDRWAGYMRDGHIRTPSDLSGIGEIYRVVTLALGFHEAGTIYDDAGKTMGLASYGKRFSAENLFFEPAPNGELRFDRAADSLVELGVAVLEGDELRLVSRPPRAPYEPFHHDLAAQLQEEFEEAVLHLTRHVLAVTGSRSLALSGGSFLNSKLNTRIMRETEIDRMFVFPAATDDGNAVGAVLYAHHNLMGHETVAGPAMRHVYLGPPRLTGVDLQAIAERWHLEPREHGGPEELAAAAAGAIARGEIIGWFQNQAEFGPRSLGARSILCHPGIPGMKDRLNARVKFRESFRPFAGSVLTERAHKWFDMPARESPFMLMVCPVLDEQRRLISEVVHVDGTCRVQTVDEDTPGPFRALIEAFEIETGLPLVLNTSFNLRGMPIVERPEEAMDCLYGSRLDRLFIGDLEIPAPDLTALRPERVRTAPGPNGRREQGVPISPEWQRILDLADGVRSMRDIARELEADVEELVDLALEMRRRKLLRWAGLPRVTGPRFPLQQYSPDTQ